MTIATSTKLKINWVNTLFFIGLHIGALFALIPSNFSWRAVGVALFLYWVSGGLGVTLGFHRLVTHRSFQTPKWLEYFLVFCGTLTCEGGPIEWVGIHRIHHLHSDTANDPHDSNKGFWWSHLGWMIYHSPAHAEVPRFTKDISDDPVYQFLQKYFIFLQIALGLVLFFLGGWSFVVWGIFVRIVWVYHCTWLVNSATHKFGYRTYPDSGDNSTNCWWVALLVFGEGWHNNHHAFQYSARHGLQWWEIDMTWMTIQLLQLLGLATNIKLADKRA
ncbi:MAG: acyl-CoA desaturase [Sphaerospermopsis kisseleviana]|jgi:fatty-acid desaturase|uniref:Stearoyl-CoA 9-desaturase n=4 Tax=Nostocales TaxID=1161 RepID=A0A479ZX35_9CYAN|nr:MULTISPECIES: acyl-CoA desaturase [Sphaerospermopsis]BAZ81061.1 stearoyl-CoA 9-desaturase [Sphaerospermopsis kisseleviana NIES-73]MBD2131717.1 acyl-CoA desaturase [Sphaerospermopsis sp. FACHB-1094]MBD2147512.1 acyl-CoA desaturase [Sphaerospermopsis sp. FACHB-1194]MBE9234950.1 acyl-CoA desaturase [Sphaerospermopsis aphanizomenoides LEGE 00250]MDB9443646.1 acyl-CoA desaturase [Sphaerospermopsis kisseleviana CS-549]